MKILINAITLDSAPLESLMSRVRYWQSQGAEITFLGNKHFKNKVDSFSGIENYHFIFLGNGKDTRAIKSKLLFAAECLKRNISALFYLGKIKGEFDVVYSVASVLDLVIIPYALKVIDKKVKWGVVFHNVVPLRDPGRRLEKILAWIFFHISQLLIRKADIIFTISEDLKNYLIKNGFEKKRIIITGNAVENEMIQQAQKEDRLASDALFLGRINETKGIFDMLKVLQEVCVVYPGFQLSIAGDGDEKTKNKFKNKITEMGLEKNIKLLGYIERNEKYSLIKSAKCFWFLSFSQSESFGIALLEAVCSGVPAFACNLPQYAYLYKNGEVDISPVGDWKKVAEKVIELFNKGNFENEEGRKLLGKYSWEKIAKIEFDAFT